MGHRVYILLLMIFYIPGCATSFLARPDTLMLYGTDKNSTTLLGGIRNDLESKKYVIKKIDFAAGILITEPRKFSFVSDGEKTTGNQSIQLRQEGGSLNIRIKYQCKSNSSDEFKPCNVKDEAAMEKLNKIESGALKIIKSHLKKSTTTQESSSAKSVDID